MSSPRPRPALDTMPAYKPGRPPAPGERASYKLSSNENPYPPLPGVVDTAISVLQDLNRYPDMAAAGLHAALAYRLGVDVARIATGAGSVAVLYHLLQAMCADGDEVVYAWRSFEAYPIAAGLTGATPVPVPLTADARHDLPAMRAAMTARTRVVIVCTPNNPTSTVVGADELEAFVASVPSDVVVVVDEAYREFVDDPASGDGLDVAAGRDNVVVLRTFSKAYGLAGLRVGYAVASPELADAIRKCSLPFGVSNVAQAAALASLDAEGELLERVAGLVSERRRVVRALTDQGWDIPQAQGNFVWLALGDASAEFAGTCEAAGVSVRPFQGDGVRVTIGEQAANDLFLQIAAAAAP